MIYLSRILKKQYRSGISNVYKNKSVMLKIIFNEIASAYFPKLKKLIQANSPVYLAVMLPFLL